MNYTLLLTFIIGVKATAFGEVHSFVGLSQTVCPGVIVFLILMCLFLILALLFPFEY